MDLGPCVPTEGTGKDQAPQTGTTIVAVSFKGGVVLGADGRVSTGTYISNRASNKIHQLTDNVFLLRSGSAADTQAIGDYGALRACALAAAAQRKLARNSSCCCSGRRACMHAGRQAGGRARTCVRTVRLEQGCLQLCSAAAAAAVPG